ncbi:protein-disulfide reductase DsbD domain-containing protein [Pedobacter jeongneungensis]|uniref:protein-disulfide reductase DsbD domain-containing protein n=1 Tax=Pedobacter jeongneungensis TaxID=947309 RepID=UPI000469AF25|nr:protein-disulfide reductase DsbD domain-containing protein [Pedobacter jeongneungensis]
MKYVKKILIPLFVLALLSTSASAQIFKPVKWSYASKRTGKNEAILFIRAVIDQGWHIYSQDMTAGSGPVKTSFQFVADKLYKLDGKVSEPQSKKVFDPNFNMVLEFLEGSVTFQQKIKLSSGTPTKVSGSVHFMVCDEERCLPPEDVKFSILVK